MTDESRADELRKLSCGDHSEDLARACVFIHDLESQLAAKDRRIEELERRASILGDLANMLAEDYRDQAEKRADRLASIKDRVGKVVDDEKEQRARADKAEAERDEAQLERDSLMRRHCRREAMLEAARTAMEINVDDEARKIADQCWPGSGSRLFPEEADCG